LLPAPRASRGGDRGRVATKGQRHLPPLPAQSASRPDGVHAFASGRARHPTSPPLCYWDKGSPCGRRWSAAHSRADSPDSSVRPRLNDAARSLRPRCVKPQGGSQKSTGTMLRRGVIGRMRGVPTTNKPPRPSRRLAPIRPASRAASHPRRQWRLAPIRPTARRPPKIAVVFRGLQDGVSRPRVVIDSLH